MSKDNVLCVFILVVVSLVLATLACGPIPGTETPDAGSSGSPSVVITSPPSGTTVVVGEEAGITSLATAAAGVDRVELLVNGQVVRTDAPPSGNPPSFSVVQAWMPTEEGGVAVSVVAYDTDGAASEPATIMVQVTRSKAEATRLSPTERPTVSSPTQPPPTGHPTLPPPTQPPPTQPPPTLPPPTLPPPTDTPAPTATPTPRPATTIYPPFIPAMSGSVVSDGTILADLPAPGDTYKNESVQGFFTFDVSALPAGATVESAVLNLGPCFLQGDGGLGDLGPLHIVDHQYGSLDAGDYNGGGTPITSISSPSCNAEANVTSSVQARVGLPYYQLRLFFNSATDYDGDADGAIFSAPTLTITYR